MSSIQLEGIEAFCYLGHFELEGFEIFQAQKIRQEKLSQFTKTLKYIKSSCAILFKYSKYIYLYYSQKEPTQFGLELLVAYGF